MYEITINYSERWGTYYAIVTGNGTRTASEGYATQEEASRRGLEIVTAFTTPEERR